MLLRAKISIALNPVDKVRSLEEVPTLLPYKSFDIIMCFDNIDVIDSFDLENPQSIRFIRFDSITRQNLAV